MQRIGTDGKRRIILFAIVSVVFAAVLIGADQLTKWYFTRALEKGDKQIDVIPNFFYFTYVLNGGAAYGILQGKRTLFLITTPIALVVFAFFYVYAFKKGYKTLLVAIALIFCGAAGNFIDRAFMASSGYAVTDFICIEIAGNRIFGVFNVADAELSAGVVLVVVHLLFLDRNAIFKKKSEDSAENNSENGMNSRLEEQNNTENNTVCDKCDKQEKSECDVEFCEGKTVAGGAADNPKSDSEDKNGIKND